MTVTLELLFPHLDELIQTPTDLQRLNAAILQLAVQGKLVPQDPGDEPAGELLKRIAAKKEQLINDGKLKKDKQLPAIDKNDTPFILPRGWGGVRLNQVCYVGTGSTPRRDEPKYYENGNIPWITSSVTGQPFVAAASEYITEKALKETNCTVYPKHSLVVALYGQGKTRGQISELLIEAATNQACAVLVFNEFSDELQPYVKIYFQKIYQELRSLAEGGAQPNLNVGKVKETIIPLPPLAEQKRIVAKVNELFAQTRALEAKLRRAQEAIVVVNRAVLHQLHHAADNATFQHAAQILGDHFDLLYTDPRPVTDLRQTILQLAVQGKLVPQDPQDEPAGALLKRIAVEKARLVVEGKLKKEKQLSIVDEDDIPFILPKGWSGVRLDQICYVGTGSTPRRDEPKYYENGNIPWITSSVTGQPFVTEASEYITEKALKATNCTVYPKHSLVVALYGQGKTRGQISELLIEAATNQACAVLVFNGFSDELQPYVKIYFQKIYQELRSLAEGGAQPNLNVGKVKETIIPLPPLAEQKRIVAKVDELLARCAALESKLGQAQVAGGQLTAAVLHGAVG